MKCVIAVTVIAYSRYDSSIQTSVRVTKTIEEWEMIKINTEFLISLVERRFAIWDKKILIKLIDQQIKFRKNEKESDRIPFSKSLLPSLRAFNDDEILEFQVGVINLMQ